MTVLAKAADETFEADAETEQLLLQAIERCNRGKTTPMTQLLAELRAREFLKQLRRMRSRSSTAILKS